jgi:hypothetical protein
MPVIAHTKNLGLEQLVEYGWFSTIKLPSGVHLPILLAPKEIL